MIEYIVLFTSILHFRGLAGSLDVLKGFGSDLDFSCGRTDGRTDERTEVFQEVLADLKMGTNFKDQFLKPRVIDCNSVLSSIVKMLLKAFDDDVKWWSVNGFERLVL